MNLQYHKPQYYPISNSDDIVIFIHGFMGSPNQFSELMAVAQLQSFATATLLLPGHGDTPAHFGASTFEQWQSHVNSEICRFSCEYENIWLVGHSMGGLLALNSSVDFPDKVRGVLTIATPFIIPKTSIYSVKTRIKHFLSKKDSPIKSKYLSSSSVKLSPSLLWNWQKPTNELKELMTTARINLPVVTVPVTAVYSESDETTHISSLGVLHDELTRTHLTPVVLTKSLHAYYPKEEQLIINEALLQLISRENAENIG